MNLKEKYRRFRAWQQKPFDFSNHSKGTERCANCGTEFSSNYCPICGQKAGIGPIGWKTVKQGVMMIWGMDSRSLSYSLLQLILRPGYLISDYINGKRQVTFPPVKMLLIVAIVGMIARSLFGELELEIAEETQDAASQLFTEWSASNPGWAMLGVSIMMLLPTWLYFRHAPKHYKHTLPEGFFIQVFMSTQLELLDIVASIFQCVEISMFFPICYVITYRQLFGFGWWGTIWRMALCFIQALIQTVLILQIANTILGSQHDRPITIIILLIFSLLLLLPGIFIGRKKRKGV